MFIGYYLFAETDPTVSKVYVIEAHLNLSMQYFHTYGISFVSLFITTTTAKWDTLTTTDWTIPKPSVFYLTSELTVSLFDDPVMTMHE